MRRRRRRWRRQRRRRQRRLSGSWVSGNVRCRDIRQPLPLPHLSPCRTFLDPPQTTPFRAAREPHPPARSSAARPPSRPPAGDRTRPPNYGLEFELAVNPFIALPPPPARQPPAPSRCLSPPPLALRPAALSYGSGSPPIPFPLIPAAGFSPVTHTRRTATRRRRAPRVWVYNAPCGVGVTCAHRSRSKAQITRRFFRRAPRRFVGRYSGDALRVASRRNPPSHSRPRTLPFRSGDWKDENLK